MLVRKARSLATSPRFTYADHIRQRALRTIRQPHDAIRNSPREIGRKPQYPGVNEQRTHNE